MKPTINRKGRPPVGYGRPDRTKAPLIKQPQIVTTQNLEPIITDTNDTVDVSGLLLGIDYAGTNPSGVIKRRKN